MDTKEKLENFRNTKNFERKNRSYMINKIIEEV